MTLLFFFIYSLIILIILVYVSPLLSALIMILVPIVFIYILPENAIQFLSIIQFLLVEGTVPVYNIHILLLVWSAFIGVIAYAEVLTWYLLREPQRVHVAGDEPKTLVFKIKDFSLKLYKILKGEKIKVKP